MPAIRTTEGDLLVTPPTFPSTEVKDDLGGRWVPEEKAWRLPLTALNVQHLVRLYGKDILDGCPETVFRMYGAIWGFMPDFELEERAKRHYRWKDLYPFQKEAVTYMVSNPHNGALLGLEPGLGKTATTIVALDVLGAERVLVIAPTTLTKNWEREFERWSDLARDVKIATASDKDPGLHVTVTNHETLNEVVLRDEDGVVFTPEWATNARRVKQWREEGPTKVDAKGKEVPARERIVQARRSYSDIDWDAIVIDESILYKNRKAVKVDVLQQLGKYAQHLFLLSGSSVSKFRDDLYPQMRAIKPKAFSSYWRFAEHFCVVERGQWGWSIQGNRPNIDPLEELKDFMFVRSQKDVLPDLPEYILQPLELDLTEKQRKAHDKMVDEWIAELEENPEGDLEAVNVLSQMTRLQQITSNLCNLPVLGKDREPTGKYFPNSSAKEDALVDLIKQDEVRTPLLVWVQYVPTGESYAARLSKEFPDMSCAFVRGAQSEAEKAERQKVLDSFATGDLDILVMQLDVGKFGHTFTQTRTVYYGDRSWSSDAIVQSLRRVRRIGLTHTPVLIVPRCPGTVDEMIEANLEGKFHSIAQVSRTDLVDLLSSLGRAT